jgi:hypothetical protein
VVFPNDKPRIVDVRAFAGDYTASIRVSLVQVLIGGGEFDVENPSGNGFGVLPDGTVGITSSTPRGDGTPGTDPPGMAWTANVTLAATGDTPDADVTHLKVGFIQYVQASQTEADYSGGERLVNPND